MFVMVRKTVKSDSWRHFVCPSLCIFVRINQLL
jgi:hypothetical protein